MLRINQGRNKIPEGFFVAGEAGIRLLDTMPRLPEGWAGVLNNVYLGYMPPTRKSPRLPKLCVGDDNVIIILF